MVALAWRAMDGFYEEDERYPRPRGGPVPPDRHPPQLPPARRPRRRPGGGRHHESARAERVGLRPALVRAPGRCRRRPLTVVELQTFCPYKGIASGSARAAAPTTTACSRRPGASAIPNHERAAARDRARLDRLPPAPGGRDPARELHDHVVPARAGRRRADRAGGPRPVPHGAPAAGPRRAADDPQLLALGRRGERGYRISVKREGAANRHLHAHAAVGDAIEAAAPRGTFTLRAGTRPVVLISAGVGATPVLAMLHALAHEPSTRPVWWLHGARNHGEHAFGPEVDALIAALPHARRVVAFSRPGGAAVSGRLDLTVLDVPLDADFYVCGPDGFMRDVGAALTARGVAARARPHRSLRDRPHPRLRPGQGRRAPAARSRRTARRRTRDHLRPQPPHDPLGRPLREPARPRRGLRRTGRLRLPQRRLPQLREQPARRHDRLRPRSARSAARRPDPRLLQPAHLRAHARPVAILIRGSSHSNSNSAAGTGCPWCQPWP